MMTLGQTLAAILLPIAVSAAGIWSAHIRTIAR